MSDTLWTPSKVGKRLKMRMLTNRDVDYSHIVLLSHRPPVAGSLTHSFSSFPSLVFFFIHISFPTENENRIRCRQKVVLV